MLETCLLSLACALPLQDDAGEKVRTAYRSHYESRDAAALQAVWRKHPGLVLITIDADLEESLSVWEKDHTEGDHERIAGLHARALWGAEQASAALGRPIFADYASSFVGWNPDQKRAFRAGQAAYRAAMKAFRAGEFELALAKGGECHRLAAPLGDWWGAAMGLSVGGMAHEALGKAEAALDVTSRARMINHQLGLAGAEYQNLRGIVSQATSLDRLQRARVAANAAAKLARQLGDEKGLADILDRRAELEQRLGLDAAAEATKKELETLGD